MNRGPDTFGLLMRYLDGRLDADGMREVNDLLRRDGEARQWLREVAGQAVAMGDLARSRVVEKTPQVVPMPARNWNWRLPLAWAAAVAILATAGLLAGRHIATRPVATLTEATGSVIWTGHRGETRREMSAGARLRNGRLETVGAVASAQLRFKDGTVLTLVGNSEILFSVNGRKLVELKSGSLSASVAKQPAGRPMIIRTSTAEMEVLGTAFAVNAQADETRLDVAEGSVRMRRLVDGHAVDVGAKHSAVASLDAQKPLTSATSVLPPTEWRTDFSAPPGPGSKGELLAATGGLPARMRSVPLVMARKKEGSPIIHYGVVARDQSRPSAGSFAALTSDSVVRLRWRANEPTGLFIFLVTQRPGGAFGGNLELKLPGTAGAPDADGWRTVSLPLRSFRPPAAHHADFPGKFVSILMVTTYEKDAGLEIAEMGIGNPRP